LTLNPICASVLDLSDAALISGVYQAGITTISNGNVLVGSNVILKAGLNVMLQGGFMAPTNSIVKIEIGSCN